MAKEIFNSPRYEKKGFISQDGAFPSLYLLSIFVWIFIAGYFKLDSDTAIISFVLVLFFVPIVFIFGKFKYRQYQKRLSDKLFYTNGKTRYTAPHEFGMTLSDNFSLYLDMTLRLLSIIMKADKEERVVEMEKVKTYIMKEAPSDYKNRLDQFNNYLKEDFAVEDVAFAMYWWAENNISNTLKTLFDLAYADGDFCEEEEYMLRYMAYHMHITETNYEKILKQYIYEYQSNNYDEYYNQYMKARYKRVGGYWYRDRKGRKQWYSFKDDEQTGDYSSSSGSDNTTTPSISAELLKAYAVLGISVDATPSEIKACKRNLLRLNHPDLFSTRGQEAISAATLKCQKINQAYELLRTNGKC